MRLNPSSKPACQQVQELLPQLSEHELDVGLERKLRDHLDDCEECRELARWQYRADTALRQARLAIPDPGDMKAEFYAALSVRKRYSSFRSASKVLVYVMLTALVIGSGMKLFTHPGSTKSIVHSAGRDRTASLFPIHPPAPAGALQHGLSQEPFTSSMRKDHTIMTASSSLNVPVLRNRTILHAPISLLQIRETPELQTSAPSLELANSTPMDYSSNTVVAMQPVYLAQSAKNREVVQSSLPTQNRNIIHIHVSDPTRGIDSTMIVNRQGNGPIQIDQTNN